MEYFNEDDARAFNTWLADFSGEIYREGFVDGEDAYYAYA